MLKCKILDKSNVNVNFDVNDYSVTLCLKGGMITNKCFVNSPQISVPLKFEESTPPQDDLQDYVLNFLQWYFIIIQLKDAIHEGDLDRTNIILKHMVPSFYSHSCWSKYFVECIENRAYTFKTTST